MKNFAAYLFSLLLACQVACVTKPDAVSVKSSNAYAVPRFEDSASFERLRSYDGMAAQVFRDYLKNAKAPSVAYAVVAGGQVVISGAAGYGNVENHTPADTKSVYRIASMSKSFTAMAILRLRDEGKLSLDDPVYKYLPEFSSSGSLTADAPPVTIFHLLTMSSGFPEDNPSGDWQLDDSEEDLLYMLSRKLSLSNVPGVQYEYSNLGYMLLGRIVTRVSGVSYQEYIGRTILNPLRMKDTYWEYSDVPAERLARGYRATGEGWSEVPLLHDGVGGAMGGMITTIEDFCKYMSFHLSAWPPRDTEHTGPVKRSSLREMHQCWRFGGLFSQSRTRSGEICPTATGYGFGLGWRKDCRGITRISHTGGLPGFGSIWAMYPEYGIAVAAFSNHTYGAPSRPSLVMLDTLIQLAGLKPRSLAPSAILKKRQGEIVGTLTTWAAEDSTLFTENFFIDRPLADWRTHCASVFDLSGKILEVGEVAPENQLRGSFIMKGERASVSVYFTLAPEAAARVQELSVEVVEGPQ